ncbi:tRNA (adenosine(37)-N6)-threonylcarbamoyltransferase complex transferase subunit TsaD [Patescibacteria group bacterium]|nr:tRNA (adenosine(37)-N6)-threonylcarbamoyltransferase complex transferase subunit TsaD [Patescibacteria group bacterium]MBU1877139.1 tRNA (adenosine(37)-N6)-threonylcarbamoyltransferase complex transferase subunit TsaD [Patescibacteria group bacterium]
MNILGIETSCDDTGISIIKCETKSEKRKAIFDILSNVVSSQTKIHAQYGGVYPMLAKREHEKNLPIVYKTAIKRAFGRKKPQLDLIAVTNGPGLEPCLWQGINFAKKLSEQLKIPIIPINHIEAHILVNFINQDFQSSTFNFQRIFPAIALIVSGGHTQLILMKNFGKYKILGETLDDAAGECFDKTARVLGLSYPGGPAIEIEASKANREPSSISLPRPMIYQKNYNFSFSGLKTAVLYKVKNEKRKTKNEKYIQEMALEIQNATINVLSYKTFKAAEEYQVKSIFLGGGVTANKQLRKRFKQQARKYKIKLFVPDKKYSTDNAVMTAITGYFNWLKIKGKMPKNIEANGNLRLK